MLNANDLRAEIIATIENVLAHDGIGAGDYIRVARFIGELDATRENIVATFRELYREGVIDLAPESNTKVLKPEDKRYALVLGSEPLHLVCLQP